MVTPRSRNWTDPRTVAPVHNSNQLQLNQASPNNRDMLWLSDRTTIAINQ